MEFETHRPVDGGESADAIDWAEADVHLPAPSQVLASIVAACETPGEFAEVAHSRGIWLNDLAARRAFTALRAKAVLEDLDLEDLDLDDPDLED